MKHVGELDTMLINHGHFDHFENAVSVALRTGATAVANVEIFSYMQGQGVQTAAPIQKGGTARVGGSKSPRPTLCTPRAYG